VAGALGSGLNTRTHEDVGWAENYTLVGFSSGFGSDPRVRN
jgi:hypothetical protein